jgi:hypothetical protein
MPIFMREYKPWAIYRVMEYIIWCSMQNGKEWVYDKLNNIFWKLD